MGQTVYIMYFWCPQAKSLKIISCLYIYASLFIVQVHKNCGTEMVHFQKAPLHYLWLKKLNNLAWELDRSVLNSEIQLIKLAYVQRALSIGFQFFMDSLNK